jgi:ABC-type lipoprotein release transport system permease subunit
VATIAWAASIVATWIPARRAARVRPAEALRYE